MGLKELFSRRRKDDAAAQPAEVPAAAEPFSADEFIAGELAWLERIDAIPSQVMRAYVEREYMELPPLTRAMLRNLIHMDCCPEPVLYVAQGKTKELDPGAAGRIFRYLGYRPGLYSGEPGKKPDAEDQALIDRFGKDHQRSWELYEEHQERIRAVKKEGEAAREAAFAQYREHYKSLPEERLPLAGYALARQGASRGRSGFHTMQPLSAWPFSACAWARTKPVDGVAFSIGRACFAGRDPLLFYVETDIKGGETLDEADGWPAGWAGQVWQSIEGYSSGIRVEGLRGPVILFRLDETKIKKLDILYGGAGASAQPDYVFTWPGAGEFDCSLGEVADGKLIPLHRDDFCMK